LHRLLSVHPLVLFGSRENGDVLLPMKEGTEAAGTEDEVSASTGAQQSHVLQMSVAET
jgi:hypothetical protein